MEQTRIIDIGDVSGISQVLLRILDIERAIRELLNEPEAVQ